MDNAEHALFVCAKWGVAREALGQAVCAELTPHTMVSLMLQPERNWMLTELFVTLVIPFIPPLAGAASRFAQRKQRCQEHEI